jgi:DNA polymerase-3 subunit gamma/tau
MDQASVLGAGEIGEDVVASLVGAGPSDVQYALADAVAVGDARTMFELVNGIVQEGRDLRHVTNETLTHFRNLLLARTAPEQGELLDVTEDEVEKLRAQAAKFSPAELARVISLLLAAQTDMRWTTSPRLTLELALVRATIPETDAQPHGLVSRIERLERLAGIAPGVTVGEDAARDTSAVGADEPRREPSQLAPAAAETPVSTAPEVAEREAQPVVGAGTAAVDVSMIRSSWGALIGHLRSERKLVIASFLEVATPAAYDGETLELVFPPDRPFGASKVEEREGELRGALQAVLGVAPRVRCVVRDAVAGPVDPEEDEPPLSEEEALARLKAELGARSAPESD